MTNKQLAAIAVINLASNLHIIQVHRSRTSYERHYRVFTCFEDIEDVTSFVCLASGMMWDDVRGTLVIRGEGSLQDAYNIQSRLQAATEWKGKVIKA